MFCYKKQRVHPYSSSKKQALADKLTHFFVVIIVDPAQPHDIDDLLYIA